MGRAGFEHADLDICNLGKAGSRAQSCSPSADNYEVILTLEEVVNRAQGREIGFSHDENVSDKFINQLYRRWEKEEECQSPRNARPTLSITGADAESLYR